MVVLRRIVPGTIPRAILHTIESHSRGERGRDREFGGQGIHRLSSLVDAGRQSARPHWQTRRLTLAPVCNCLSLLLLS